MGIMRWLRERSPRSAETKDIVEGRNFEIAASTIPSDEHARDGKGNEDAEYHDLDGNIVALDAVSTSRGGHEASNNYALPAIVTELRKLPKDATSEAAVIALGTSLLQANSAVTTFGREKFLSEEQAARPSVAAFAGRVCADNKLAYSTAGDCRLAMFRGGRLNSVTVDHVEAFSYKTNEEALKYQDELWNSRDEQLRVIDGGQKINKALGQGSGNYPVTGITDFTEGDIALYGSDMFFDNTLKDELEIYLNKNSHLPAEQILEGLKAMALRNAEKEGYFKGDDDFTLGIVRRGKAETVRTPERSHAVPNANIEKGTKQNEIPGINNFAPGQLVRLGSNFEQGPYKLVGENPHDTNSVLIETVEGNYSVSKQDVVEGKKIIAHGIKNADSIDTLINIITNHGGIQGSEFFYPANTLNNQIYLYVQQELGSLPIDGERIDISAFPKALGFRQKFDDLVKLQKARLSLK